MGKLTIEGTLDVAQFWPTGESDADTTKLILNVTPGSIRYQPIGGGPQATTRFDGAFVKSFGQPKLVINNGKMTVRLQGLDAPELHVQPQSMKGTKYKGQDLGSLKGSGLVKKYRQHQAETATVRLGTYLRTLGTSPLPCQFFTEVDDDEGPADAIDKYGRFVGNVLINAVDVNLEILRQGLAVVALYNSMQRSEIEACLRAWNTGANAAGGIVRYITKTIGTFDAQLTYRKPAGAVIVSEKVQKFIHPKLYRRQCTWWAYKKFGTFRSGFDTFLTLSKNDVFFELSSVLDDGRFAAVPIPLDKMVKGGKTIMYGPDQVVFKEAPSRLYAIDGKVIDQW